MSLSKLHWQCTSTWPAELPIEIENVLQHNYFKIDNTRNTTFFQKCYILQGKGPWVTTKLQNIRSKTITKF